MTMKSDIRGPRTPVSDLDLVLPKNWPLFDPVQIHPESLGWFRANYERSRASLHRR